MLKSLGLRGFSEVRRLLTVYTTRLGANRTLLHGSLPLSSPLSALQDPVRRRPARSAFTKDRIVGLREGFLCSFKAFHAARVVVGPLSVLVNVPKPNLTSIRYNNVELQAVFSVLC